MDYLQQLVSSMPAIAHGINFVRFVNRRSSGRAAHCQEQVDWSNIFSDYATWLRSIRNVHNWWYECVVVSVSFSVFILFFDRKYMRW